MFRFAFKNRIRSVCAKRQRTASRLAGILTAALCLALLLPTLVRADNLTVTDYQTEIEYFEDNSVEVTERIKVRFNVDRFGIKLIFPWMTNRGDPMIIRNIKTNRFYTVTRESPGPADQFRGLMQWKKRNREGDKASNLPYNKAYKLKNVETDNDMFKGSTILAYGHPFKHCFEGSENVYEISYRVELGRDPFRKFDEIYWNIINAERPYPHDRVRFKITLPKTFDAEQIEFFVGKMGKETPGGVRYKVKERSIVGEVKGGVGAYEAVTVRMPLPEGYFSKAKSIPIFRYLFYRYVAVTDFLPLLWLIPALLVYDRFGKRRRVIPTVEFYPPIDTNSAEAAWLLFGHSLHSDFTSLLVYWADKGYLQIEDVGKKSVRLHRLVEEPKDGHDYEKQLFNSMFDHGNGKTVTTEQLKQKFYADLDRAARRMRRTYNRFEETIPMDQGQDKTRTWMRVFGFMAYSWPILKILRRLLFVSDVAEGALETLYLGGGMCFMMFLITVLWFQEDNEMRMRKRHARKGRRTRPLFSTAHFGPLFLTAFVSIVFYKNNALLSLLIATVTVRAIAGLCARVDRRTKIGEWYVNHLAGFAEFIRTAEVDRIKMLVNDNPQYFYHVLPYAMTLEVCDEWIKRFKTIAVPPPEWYKTDKRDIRDSYIFQRNMVRQLELSGREMALAPARKSSDSGSSSSSDSGSSSSGGSAGGGSGGTGMSDW